MLLLRIYFTEAPGLLSIEIHLENLLVPCRGRGLKPVEDILLRHSTVRVGFGGGGGGRRGTPSLLPSTSSLLLPFSLLLPSGFSFSKITISMHF